SVPPSNVVFMNDATTKSRPRGREYTRPCQIRPVLVPAPPGEIDAAFATLRQRRAGALLVGSGTRRRGDRLRGCLAAIARGRCWHFSDLADARLDSAKWAKADADQVAATKRDL